MMAQQRVTLVHVEVDASWRSVAWGLFDATAFVLIALWWRFA